MITSVVRDFLPPTLDRDSEEWRTLDGLLPENHLVRVIDRWVDEVLDLSELVACYAGRGSRPHRPDLLLKLALYEHAIGRHKPSQWVKDLQDGPTPVKWLTQGIGPSQTAVYQFRDRLGPHLKAWNEAMIEHAIDQGMTDASVTSLDGTTIDANASRHHMFDLKRTQKRIEQLEQARKDSGESAAWMSKTEQGRNMQQQKLHKTQQRLLALHAANDRRRKDKRKKPERIVVAPSDLDSYYGKSKTGEHRPLYNIQVMADVRTNLVLAWMTCCQPSDSGMLVPMIEATPTKPTTVLADAAYSVPKDLAWCDQHGVTLLAPYQENSFTASKRAKRIAKSAKAEMFGKEQFKWEAETQTYRCPADQTLPFAKNSTRQRADGSYVTLQIYQADPAVCKTCPSRASCTKSGNGRTVRRQQHQEHVDRLQIRMQTPEAQAQYKHRSSTVERVFADIKENRNLRRFSARGCHRVDTETGLTILVHNLRLLANFAARDENLGKSAA